GFRCSRSHLLPRSHRMAVCGAVVPGLLEQEIRNPWSARRMFFLYRHLHHYPIYAGWLGCICGGLPCNDRKSCVSYEGSRSVGGVVLSVKARRRESGAVEGSLCRITETTLPEDESRQGLERTRMNVRNDNIPTHKQLKGVSLCRNTESFSP